MTILTINIIIIEWELDLCTPNITSRSGIIANDEIKTDFFRLIPNIINKNKGIMKCISGSGIVINSLLCSSIFGVSSLNFLIIIFTFIASISVFKLMTIRSFYFIFIEYRSHLHILQLTLTRLTQRNQTTICRCCFNH